MTAATRWIMIIVGLLVANALAMGFLVMASSTSRAEVIPDYYAKAASYDTVIDQAEKNRTLGWRIERVQLDHELAIDVRDAEGGPLEGARVHVTAVPRAHGHAVELDLTARGEGRYAVAHRAGGLQDLAIVIERGGERFTARVTIECRGEPGEAERPRVCR